MSRKFFINPYTFVPLCDSGPVLKPVQKDKNNLVHLYFDQERFTGCIDVELNFITPAVVPGEQQPGSESEPGFIPAYRYGNRCLAIPGSRIRGGLTSLMRTINSSPFVNWNDRTILRRDTHNHQKGVLIKEDNEWKITPISNEILVADPLRTKKPKLFNDYEAEANAIAYYGNASKTIPDYKEHFKPKDGNQISLPPHGTVYWQNSTKIDRQTKRIVPNEFKRYLVKRKKGCQKFDGNWIKFPAWSGQDGINRMEDLSPPKSPMTHRNSYHLVKAAWINFRNPVVLPKDVIDAYDQSIKEAATLMANRDKDPKIIQGIRAAGPLKPGMFVYFEVDNGNRVKSLGQHYRYLMRCGALGEKVLQANDDLVKSHVDRCVVEHLTGYVNEGENGGMKGRLWVEMAMGPNLDTNGNCSCIEKKNLRVLSSQPPKAVKFYLKGGDYDTPGSRPRGRKFYWHDPLWDRKMWDNEDLNRGNHAFENPQPDRNKKQWSSAEVIMASYDNMVTFRFRIRVMNLSINEKNLLLTSILGFGPQYHQFKANGSMGCLAQKDFREWCHKIGYARPFLGSGFMLVSGIERLVMDPKTWEPTLQKLDAKGLKQWQNQLVRWQENELKGSHLPGLKRVMRFEGARGQCQTEEERADVSPITYPLGQKTEDAGGQNHLSWVSATGPEITESKQPKTYHWFTNKPQNLPEPNPGKNQNLEVWFQSGKKGGGKRTAYKKKKGKR